MPNKTFTCSEEKKAISKGKLAYFSLNNYIITSLCHDMTFSLINSFSLSSIVFVRLMKKCLRMTIFIIQHFLASIPRISSARAQMGLPGSNGKSRIEFTLLFFREMATTQRHISSQIIFGKIDEKSGNPVQVF